MAKYRIKPVEIQAWQYNGETTQLPYEAGTAIVRSRPNGPCYLKIGNNDVRCDVGHFIVLQADGAFDVYSPEYMSRYEKIAD